MQLDAITRGRALSSQGRSRKENMQQDLCFRPTCIRSVQSFPYGISEEVSMQVQYDKLDTYHCIDRVEPYEDTECPCIGP